MFFLGGDFAKEYHGKECRVRDKSSRDLFGRDNSKGRDKNNGKIVPAPHGGNGPPQ